MREILQVKKVDNITYPITREEAVIDKDGITLNTKLSKIGTNTTDISSIKNDISGIKNDITSLKSKDTSLEASIKNNSTNIATLDGRLDGIEDNISDISNYLDTIKHDNFNDFDKTKVTSIIIDQSYTQGNKVFITGQIGKDNNDSSSTIKWIRDNTYLVMGAPNKNNANELIFKRLTNISQYNNTSYRNNKAVDVFVKLPEFYYRTIPLIEGDKNWGNEKVILQFARKENVLNDEYSDYWNHWDGKYFIGRYLMGDNNNKGTSVPGAPIALSDENGEDIRYTWEDYDRLATRNYSNHNYCQMPYEVHKILTLLFYAWYGEVDSQAVLGYGRNQEEEPYHQNGYYEISQGNWDSYIIAIGDSNDTIRKHHSNDVEQLGNGNTNDGNMFWGIEDLFGTVYQYLGNVVAVGEVTEGFAEDYPYLEPYIGKGVNVVCAPNESLGIHRDDAEETYMYALPDEKDLLYIIPEGGKFISNNGGCIKQMAFDKEAHVIPTKVQNGNVSPDTYADSSYVGFDDGYVAGVGGYFYDFAGVAQLRFSDEASDYALYYCGSRLVWHGDSREISLGTSFNNYIN